MAEETLPSASSGHCPKAAFDPEPPDAPPETGRSTTEKATLNSTQDRYSRFVSPARG
jgi:hypothetical protein